MPERDLPVEAGEDVQPEDRDRVHQHQVELKHAIVLHQERKHHGGHQQQRQPDPDDARLAHTLVTTCLPNSPLGISVNVPTINTSATVNFNSVPIT